MWRSVMYEIKLGDSFKKWLSGLRDSNGKARILARLRMAGFGNLGDWKSVGDGVCEMRISTGPGYRLYFVRFGSTVIIMLAGGDKSSQSRDITVAKQIAKDVKNG